MGAARHSRLAENFLDPDGRRRREHGLSNCLCIGVAGGLDNRVTSYPLDDRLDLILLHVSASRCRPHIRSVATTVNRSGHRTYKLDCSAG